MTARVPASPANRRLQFKTLPTETTPERFAQDVRQGLTSSPKWLPFKYLYDEEGSKLFERISALPEYYLTRVGRDILSANANDIVSLAGTDVTLIDLGSGSAEKTRILIEALLNRQPQLHFIPIDISRSALEKSSADLLKEYPSLRITAYVGDYHPSLETVAREVKGSKFILFLGSNIGNFDPPEAVEFLRAVRGTMGHSDRYLLSADLKKDKSMLEAAYDDKQGVTARFSLNMLSRINRELGGNFDFRRFRHRAFYNEREGRIEVHLESLAPQRVSIPMAGLEVAFEKGETIHTENSYKYTIEQIRELGSASGLALKKSWLDEQKLFSVNLLAPGE